jgi:NAD(P)-dependent dehydrogenase (short-subunit alcohol dehydrogenase family)
MSQKLAGKVAVVTGGGNGIGRAAALGLAAEGAKVVINDIGRTPDGAKAADKVVDEIKKAGGQAVANFDSVATMAGGESIIQTAVKNFGRIDILVNCAGNFVAKSIMDLTESEWDSLIAVHLKGHFSTCKAASKEMIKQKTGRIINISSRAAFNYNAMPPGSVAYSGAKAGIVGLTAQLSADVKDYGITANVILPSADTQLFPGRGQRFGGGAREGAEYVAPLIVFLATDDAKNVTGQNFYACGGDVVIFDRPMQLPGYVKFIRTQGKWDIGDLAATIPPLLGVS